MYKIPPQSYIPEFKQDAIRRIRAESKSLAQIAPDLGLLEQALVNWRKAHKAG